MTFYIGSKTPTEVASKTLILWVHNLQRHSYVIVYSLTTKSYYFADE